MDDYSRSSALSAGRIACLLGIVLVCLLSVARPALADPSPGPCGTTDAVAPATLQRVVWVVFENREYGSIIGDPNAPYVNSLAQQCGLATNSFAVAHPSLPNYIAMTSGSTQGIVDDAPPATHPLTVPSIFSQLGPDWRSLEESMPSNCLATNSGLYAVRHNPAAYYTNIDCATQDVPLTSTPDFSARFSFVTPDLCNDMHDCPVATGDAWLSTFMQTLIASPEYQAGGMVVFITWDEGSSVSQHIATLVVSPYTAVGTESADYFDHYSLLRTTEELLGLDTLGNASTAPSMRSAFGLWGPFYARPKGASPLRVSLVPAFDQCITANRTHGAPLDVPSCQPPVQSSRQLTVGTPTNGNAANAVGSVTLRAIAGNTSTPQNEADVKLSFKLTDVRNRSDLSDYTGLVLLDSSLRITDRSNGPTGSEPATTEDTRFPVTVPCAATSTSTVGGTCAVATTFNAIVPNVVIEGERSNWQLGRSEVYDAGPDTDVNTTADNTLYMDEGIFVP